MSSLQEKLLPDEKVVLTAPLHPIVLLPSVLGLNLGLAALILLITEGARVNTALHSLLAGLAAVLWLVFSAVLFINVVFLAVQALALRKTKGLAITNRRLIACCGILRPRVTELPLNKVESVGLRQSLFGRLFNYGTITVSQAGGSPATFAYVLDPQDVSRKLSQVIEYYSNVRSPVR